MWHSQTVLGLLLLYRKVDRTGILLEISVTEREKSLKNFNEKKKNEH